MVIISHYPPILTLNAYSTVPLTPEMITTTQHGFYDGTSARFGNTEVAVAIHNRTSFHGLSHYDIRVALDAEGVLDPFVVLDARTPELDAIWYVETTAKCRAWDSYISPRITYPYENFTTWQVHIRVPDLPITQLAWAVGAGSLVESVPSPYDPHDPQPDIFHYEYYNYSCPVGHQDQGLLNWTDPEQFLWGANLGVTANWTEVMWRNNTGQAKTVPHHYPFVVTLTEEAARENGFVPYWNPRDEVGRPGQVVQLSGKCDWDSPLWRTLYPDDPIILNKTNPVQRIRHGFEGLAPMTGPRPRLMQGKGHGTQIWLADSHGVAKGTTSDAIREA